MGSPIPEKIAAKAAGERYFVTDGPCSNGHLAKRYTSNGRCVMCVADYAKRWFAEHPDAHAEHQRQQRTRDPSKNRASVARWRAKNRERFLAAQQRWRDENREWFNERARAINGTRRARKRKNGGSFTAKDIKRIRAAQRDRCAFCAKRTKKLEIDHILALSRGGTSLPKNIQLLCSSCNKSKRASDQIEWARAQGRLL